MVSFLWILFRADSLADAGRVISSLGQFSWAVVAGQAWPDLSDYFGQATLTFPAWLLSVEAYFLFNLSVVELFVLIVALLPNAMAIHERFKSSAVSACFCAATVFIVVVSNVFLVTPNAFIYFRF
jgi:hypothetical protein